MFGLGLSEIIFLAILGLVVIGPKQLPELARTLGRFLNELRRTTSVLTDDLKSHMRFDPLDLDKPTQTAMTQDVNTEVPAAEPAGTEHETAENPQKTEPS